MSSILRIRAIAKRLAAEQPWFREAILTNALAQESENLLFQVVLTHLLPYRPSAIPVQLEHARDVAQQAGLPEDRLAVVDIPLLSPYGDKDAFGTEKPHVAQAIHEDSAQAESKLEDARIEATVSELELNTVTKAIGPGESRGQVLAAVGLLVAMTTVETGLLTLALLESGFGSDFPFLSPTASSVVFALGSVAAVNSTFWLAVRNGILRLNSRASGVAALAAGTIGVFSFCAMRLASRLPVEAASTIEQLDAGGSMVLLVFTTIAFAIHSGHLVELVLANARNDARRSSAERRHETAVARVADLEARVDKPLSARAAFTQKWQDRQGELVEAWMKFEKAQLSWLVRARSYRTLLLTIEPQLVVALANCFGDSPTEERVPENTNRSWVSAYLFASALILGAGVVAVTLGGAL